MVRLKVSHTLSEELVKQIEAFRDAEYPGASRSLVIEQLLRKSLKIAPRKKVDISVEK
ncbi:hypothetical protein ES703_60619 [subsurface metagenome]